MKSRTTYLNLDATIKALNYAIVTLKWDEEEEFYLMELQKALFEELREITTGLKPEEK